MQPKPTNQRLIQHTVLRQQLVSTKPATVLSLAQPSNLSTPLLLFLWYIWQLYYLGTYRRSNKQKTYAWNSRNLLVFNNSSIRTRLELRPLDRTQIHAWILLSSSLPSRLFHFSWLLPSSSKNSRHNYLLFRNLPWRRNIAAFNLNHQGHWLEMALHYCRHHWLCIRCVRHPLYCWA